MQTKILVVDDNANVISFIRPALERAGYQVTTARDGLDALYQVEAFNPALIILDIEMPPPNGLDVCRQLRERGDTTPVIFLTVRDSITDLELGFQVGADDYVTKPFDIRELLARIKARLPPQSFEFNGYCGLIPTFGKSLAGRSPKNRALTPFTSRFPIFTGTVRVST